MKQYQQPVVRVIRTRTGVLCGSNPSSHDHGWKGDGSNGKGWGPGGRPRSIFDDNEI